jgi:hypothetical protein
MRRGVRLARKLLRQPITVPLPSGEVSVVAVHFHADDAKGLVSSAQRYLVEVRER